MTEKPGGEPLRCWPSSSSWLTLWLQECLFYNNSLNYTFEFYVLFWIHVIFYN